MRKIIVAASIASLAFVACQKEQVKPAPVYGETYLRSIKDPSKLETLKEYEEEYYSIPREKDQPVTRGKLQCWIKVNNVPTQGMMCTLGGNNCTIASDCQVSAGS